MVTASLEGKRVLYTAFLQNADKNLPTTMYLIDILGVNMAFHTKDVSGCLESEINGPPG